MISYTQKKKLLDLQTVTEVYYIASHAAFEDVHVCYQVNVTAFLEDSFDQCGMIMHESMHAWAAPSQRQRQLVDAWELQLLGMETSCNLILS